MYKVDTGKTNCRRHLTTRHAIIYDKTVREKNWPYRLSSEKPGTKTTVGELRKRALPRFTLESFIEYLVRFIVADDQVSDSLSLTHVLHFPSRFVLSNVLNSATYAWSFAKVYKTTISPIETNCGRLS